VAAGIRAAQAAQPQQPPRIPGPSRAQLLELVS